MEFFSSKSFHIGHFFSLVFAPIFDIRSHNEHYCQESLLQTQVSKSKTMCWTVFDHFLESFEKILKQTYDQIPSKTSLSGQQ